MKVASIQLEMADRTKEKNVETAVDCRAEIFLIPSAWPLARIEAWRLFNRARAHENLAFLVFCNCAGENSGKRYGGHSMIVDPWGQVLAEGGEGGEIVTAEIDVGEAAKARKEFPALADRVFRCSASILDNGVFSSFHPESRIPSRASFPEKTKK